MNYKHYLVDSVLPAPDSPEIQMAWFFLSMNKFCQDKAEISQLCGSPAYKLFYFNKWIYSFLLSSDTSLSIFLYGLTTIKVVPQKQ